MPQSLLDPLPSSRKPSPLNIPNALTSLRIISIPVVVYLLYGNHTTAHRWWAAILFGLAFWTDFFDGLLARKMQSITRLGKVMDPMADKLMVITALLLLVNLHYVNVLIAIVLIGREVAVNALRTLAGAEGIVIAPSMTGRIKVFAEGFGIGFAMVGPDARWLGVPWLFCGTILLYISVALALWSGWVYFRDYYLGAIKASSS